MAVQNEKISNACRSTFNALTIMLSKAALEQVNSLQAVGMTSQEAINIVLRSHLAAAASLAATASATAGTAFDTEDLCTILRDITKTPPLPANVVEALVERDVAQTVQQ